MAFFGAPVAKGLSGVALANPLLAAAVGLTAVTVYCVCKAATQDGKRRITYQQIEERGGNSSEVEKHFNLGDVGEYSE